MLAIYKGNFPEKSGRCISMSSRFSLAPRHKFLPIASALCMATIAVSLIALIAGTGEAAGLRGAVGLDGSGGSGHSQAPDRAFGYFVGEERRYILGPSESLLEGEGRDWLIRLDRIEGDAEEFVVVFALEFEDRRPGISYRGSQEVYFRVEGELKVNRFGFPLELRYTEGEEQSGEAPWRGSHGLPRTSTTPRSDATTRASRCPTGSSTTRFQSPGTVIWISACPAGCLCIYLLPRAIRRSSILAF